MSRATHDVRLDGALDGLKILDVSDLERYKQAIDAGHQIGFAYYFPYLLSHNRPGRSAVLICYDRGSLCVFLWRRRNHEERLDVCMPPAPMHLGVLERCLERANEFNLDRTAGILRIDAKDAGAVSQLRRLRLKQRRLQYLYAPSVYANLGGNRYRTIRRNIALVERRADVEVVPYSASHAAACRELLRQWAEQHRNEHGGQGGVGTSARTIELAGLLTAPDLTGEIVLLNGRLSAFIFGGEIRPGIGCVLETKCDLGVPGLGYFSRHRFLSKLEHFVLVNDGSDAGRAGLRQLKDSFRPIELHAEYRGHQRPTASTTTRSRASASAARSTPA